MTTLNSALNSDTSIALVHEWLAARAGAEILFEEMVKPFPNGELFALTHTADVPFDFDGRSVSTSAIDRLGPLKERRSVTLPFMPAAWSSISRKNFDVVVSSSHAFAREFFRPGHDGMHCSYVHAPLRYAWTPELDGRGEQLGPVGTFARSVLKKKDLRSVAGVDSFAANSSEVASRIERFYGRDAQVIHPPVDVEYFGEQHAFDGDYLFTASRWIPYKRLDIAIYIAAALDVRLVIAGSGPEEALLRSTADRVHPGGVEFVLQPERTKLRQLMAEASAFVFPAHEDFGIIAVEAQAAGTPVIALGKGGALDTVVDGVTGALAPDQSIAAFVDAAERCLNAQISAETCRAHAKGFSAERFRNEIASWVATTVSPVRLDENVISLTAPAPTVERTAA